MSVFVVSEQSMAFLARRGPAKSSAAGDPSKRLLPRTGPPAEVALGFLFLASKNIAGTTSRLIHLKMAKSFKHVAAISRKRDKRNEN
jgi:hypothetical protein